MARARVAFAVLAVLACAVPARAADLSMTLLPAVAQHVDSAKPQESFAGGDLALAADGTSNPTKLVYLRFSLATLPEGATITGGTLRLSLVKAAQKWQLVRVLPVTFAAKLDGASPPALSWASRPTPDGPRAVGSTEARPGRDGRVDFELLAPDKGGWLKRDQREVALMLRSPTPSTEYVYRGLCAVATAASAGCAGAQPRLIVRYTLPVAAPGSPWPQPRADAQHSGRTAWHLSPHLAVAEVAHRLLYAVPGNIGFSPALAPRTAIVYTERDDKGSDKFFVTAVSEGGTERWSSPANIKAQAKFSPVIDRRGRVWVVSENALHRIEVGDAGASVVSRPLATLLGTAAVSVRVVPTVGANGAIYLSTDRGLFALAPDPDLRVWWSLAAATPFGQVALSADERTAYVVSGAKPGALAAIDNADGTVRWTSGSIDTQGEDPLPVPAVGAAPDDKGKARTAVYVVSGPALHVFEGDTGRTTARIAESYSRPVVAGTGRVVAVVKDRDQPRGRLCRFFWPSAWDEKKEGVLQVCQPDSPENLSRLSVLAMDGRDNVYLIDPVVDRENPKQKVRGYTYDFAPLFALGVDPAPSPPVGVSTNFGRNLAIGQDGTLVLANANALYAIEPKTVRSTQTAVLTGDGVTKANGTAFLAPQMTVAGDVTIGATQSLVLRSGGITFQRGFNVLRGAELQCKPLGASP